MNHISRSAWACLAMSLAAFSAHAVIAPPVLTGSPLIATINVSDALVSNFSPTRTWVQYQGNPNVIAEMAPGVGFTKVSFTGLKLSAVDINQGTGQIQREHFDGSFYIGVMDNEFAAPMGGSIDVSNLRVDLLSKTVIANIQGINGVGRLNDVAMWRFDSVEGTTVLPRPDTFTFDSIDTKDIALSISALTFTDAGRDIWLNSLGYNTKGRELFNAAPTFGSLSVTAVPEGATFSMMLLGLIGLGAVARKRNLATA